MKKRWALRFLLFVGAFVTAVVLVLQTSWAGQQLCARGRGLLQRFLGEEVELAQCRLDPLGTRIEIRGIRVGPEAAPRFAADLLLVRFAPLQAFGGTIAIDELRLDAPEAALDLTAPSAEPSEPSDDGCLAILDRIRVRDLQVTGARADLALPEGRLLSVRGLDVRGRRVAGAYDVSVGVAAGGYEDRTRHVPLEKLAARVRLDTGEEHLEVQQLDLAAGGVSVFAGGEVRRLCRPELGLRVVVKAPVESLAAAAGVTLERPRGTVELDARLEGTAEDPGGSGSLALRGVAFETVELGQLDAAFHLAERKLFLDEVVWPIEAGRAVVKGEIGLDDELPASLEVRTVDLDFHRLLARLPIKNTPVMMRIDSVHKLGGHLMGGLELVGQSELDIDAFRVRDVPWHVAEGATIVEVPGRIRLETPVRISLEGIDLEAPRITFGGGSVIDAPARLNFSNAKGMTIRAVASHLDLAHVNGHVAGISMAGAGRIEATISGPYGENLIEGSIDLEGARFMATELGHVAASVRALPDEEFLEFLDVKGRRGASSYDGDLRVDLAGDEPVLAARLQLPDGARLEDGFGAARDASGVFRWLEQHLHGRVEAVTAKVEGPVSALQIAGAIAARDVSLLGRRFDTLRLGVGFDGKTLLLEDLELARGGGKASGRAAVAILPRPGVAAAALPALDVAVDAAGQPLRQLLGELGEYADLKGGFGGKVKLEGPVERLRMSGELFAGGLSASGVPLSAARLSLTPRDDGSVLVEGPVCGAGALSATVGLREDLPFDARFAVEVRDLGRYLRPPAPGESAIGGALAGGVTPDRPLGGVGAAAGTVALPKVVLALGDYRVENQGEVRAEYAGSSFRLHALSVRGDNTELRLAGTRSAAGALDLAADGRFDARILDSVVPQIEHATGVVELKATVTGTGHKPVLVGSAQVQHGSFRARELPIQVQKLDGTLAFSQNQVVIEQAQMAMNQGRAVVRGTVALKSWAPASVDVAADLERVSWRLPADWPAVVSGRLHLGGGWPSSLLLGGELQVERLRYSKDLDLERSVFDLSRRVRQAPSADEEERLRFDVALIGGPDMRVDNNLMKAKLQFVAPPGARDARLRLVGTNVRVGLLGAVELVDAEAVFRGNEYRMTQGVVQFTERDRIDPEFDVTAETEVRDYRVTVHAAGRLPEPGDSSRFELDLASEPSLAQADIVTLLTFGITSRDTAGGAGAAAGAGVAAEALLAVSGLDEQVKRWLPDNGVFQDPNLSVTSQYSEITGQLEPMALFETKVLSDRLKLKAATPFSTSKGRRASAEYKIDEHVSGQVLWENEETGYSAGDVGLDMKLRWEWE